MNGFFKKTAAICKKQAVLCIAFLCAVISMFFVPPDALYAGYIDWRVLSQLFCLMAVVAGFRECGLMERLAARLLRRGGSMSILTLMLMLVTFFFSMLVTNDVALLTFIPFSFLVLKSIAAEEYCIRIVILQTLAANLGSMATPVGNPQNLFLYAFYSMSPLGFARIMLPLTAVCLIVLVAASLFGKNPKVQSAMPAAEHIYSKPLLLLYIVLFAVCLLCVLRVIPYPVMLAAVSAGFLLFSRRLLLKVDYALLLTFICFFVLSGNLSRIPQLAGFVEALLAENTMLCSAAVSQFISNVPAAVLLAEMTADWQGLLAGVNIGGLGTPVASLASLISLKFYLERPDAKPLRYLACFSAANFALLVLLLLFAQVLF